MSSQPKRSEVEQDDVDEVHQPAARKQGPMLLQPVSSESAEEK